VRNLVIAIDGKAEEVSWGHQVVKGGQTQTPMDMQEKRGKVERK